MDLFDAIKNRRSIRKFNSTKVPAEIIRKALEAAILAPNSSNTQTWNFHWVKSEVKKEKLIKACLSQSAARTAADLIVVSADPKLWKRSQGPLISWVKSVNVPKQVQMYYEKIIPLSYTWGWFNCFALVKHIISFVTGIFRPFLRGPHSKAELQLVAVKSAALASENLVLALTAEGVSSCMMEGFDEWRVKNLLDLSFSSRVVMVIGIGFEGERGTWGPQMRLPYDQVVYEV